MKEMILLPQDIADAGKKWLTDRGYSLKPGNGITASQIAGDVKGCSAIIARLGDYSRRVMEAEPALRIIARHGAGYDNIDLETAKRLGIWVTYDPFSNTNAVAEHVITLMMACAKNLVLMDRELRAGDFAIRNRCLTTEVYGKTIGIVGYGRIGRAVARIAESGLGMKVIAYDTCAKETQGAERMASLGQLLEQADFVSLNLPVTAETKGLFDKEKFEMMKEEAFFINAARGELVDEAALAEALEKGKIAGAALDVFSQEPPAADSPLFRSERLIVAPHNAALTREAMERMALTAAKAVDDALTGKRPDYVLSEPGQY